MQSVAVATLPLPTLPTQATTAHTFTEMKAHPLISVPKPCDNNCTITFTKHNAKVFHNNKHILTTPRNLHTKLYHLDLTQTETTPTHRCYHILPTTNNINLLKWLHQSLYSPAPTTLLKSVSNNQLATFPRLTKNNIKQHLPQSEATTKGHLNQTRKNTQSTKATSNIYT